VVADSLIFKRKVEDQSRLDSNARRKNLEGSMLADSRVFGRQVILFDDVVTTGSTILEAGRAVELAGGTVIGFLAFAETILKTHSKF
jgi:predicted amidophosphoribosyltransferase